MAGSNDESKWIEHSLSGDPEAYAALVAQHQKMIRAVTFRMTGSLDDAEELAQDAFLRAYRQLASFNHDSKFSTWLCQIAINLSLDWCRRERRRDDIHSEWAANAISENNPGGGFPDELSRRVQAALNHLPAKQRAAIVLTIYENQQQITDDARGTRLLASIQRQPAVTSLDSQGALMNLVLFTDAQNILCAAVHNKVFRWDGADWREIGAAPASFQPSVFEDGVWFLTDGWNMRPARISRLDMGSTNVELCLGQPDRQRINASSTNFNDRPKTLWKLPAELSLPNLSSALWQSDLFLITDHSEKQDIVAEERGTRPDGTLELSHVITGEKFAPIDGYDSELFCFSRGREAAEKVLLKFDNAEGCPPMAGLGSNSQPLIPQLGIIKSWMLFTPKFLLCGRERSGYFSSSSEPAGFKPGVWVEPLGSIMQEVTSLKQTQSNQKRQ